MTSFAFNFLRKFYLAQSLQCYSILKSNFCPSLHSTNISESSCSSNVQTTATRPLRVSAFLVVRTIWLLYTMIHWCRCSMKVVNWESQSSDSCSRFLMSLPYIAFAQTTLSTFFFHTNISSHYYSIWSISPESLIVSVTMWIILW